MISILKLIFVALFLIGGIKAGAAAIEDFKVEVASTTIDCAAVDQSNMTKKQMLACL